MDEGDLTPKLYFDWEIGRLGISAGLSYREWGAGTAVIFDYESTTLHFHFLCFWLDIYWSKSDG